MIKHKTPFNVTTWLNIRKEVKDMPGYYFVWIQVYFYDQNFKRFYVTSGIKATVEQYDNMFNGARTKIKPSNNDKFMSIIEMLAKADALNDFKICRSPQSFKDKWKGVKSSEGTTYGYSANLNDCFNAKISELDEAGKYGSVETFKNTRKALTVYFGKEKFNKVSLYEITVGELSKYENYHYDKGNNSPGLDFRNLRTIWNRASALGKVDINDYPFGKERDGKFVIKEGEKIPNPLSTEELKKFFDWIPNTPAREKAKDIWFMSCFHFGINLKDLCYLRHDQIKKDEITFVREKTKGKRKTKVITIPRTAYLDRMLKQYRGVGKYAFNFVHYKLHGEERYKKYQKTRRSLDKVFGRMANVEGLEFSEKLSIYRARHTFANKSNDDGMDIAVISKALGHRSIEQTEVYLKAMPTDKLKSLIENAMKI
tara:strand:- start:333 stop:1610 length:1278 start_codon:yes stop_codon:yes gene_type:complete